MLITSFSYHIDSFKFTYINEKRPCSCMAPFGIRLDHCLDGELVVIPGQFVGPVVFVGTEVLLRVIEVMLPLSS